MNNVNTTSPLAERQLIREALLANDYSALIAPDEKVEAFLADDEFWDHELIDDRDIPLQQILARDPTFIVVGKELELLTGKLAVVKAMKLEYRRQERFCALSELLLIIAYLKEGAFGAVVEAEERRLIDSGKMDWEEAYEEILGILTASHGVSIPEILDEINQQREKLNLTLRIPEALIAEKLHEEMPNPVTFLLLGDMGAGKSFIQRRLEKWRQRLYDKLDLRGYDRLLLRDRADNNKAYLRTLPSGEGSALLHHHDKQQRARRGLETWLRRAVITLLAFPPVYQAVVLGWEVAKYQWGVLGDINPLVDLGVWINDNFHWVSLYVVLFIFSQTEKWVRDSGYLERLSLRPQMVVDSLRSESVIIGDVARGKIVGNYEADFKRPPQLGLIELPNWLQTDGKSLIIEQLSDLSHDAQSIFAQLVQEREFAIADRGEYTTPFLSFLSVGQNPHVMNDLIPPLKDRLKLGSGCVVVNAVDKDQIPLKTHNDFASYVIKQNAHSSQFATATTADAELRSRRIERKFMAFLKDFREKAGAKPLERGALVFLTMASSAYADDVGKIIINREFLGYLNALMMQSTFTGHDRITKEDCAMAVLTTRTPDQKILIRTIADRNSKAANAPNSLGEANVLALAKRLEPGESPYLQDVAEENSISYIATIHARILKTGTPGLHLLHAPFTNERCEEFIIELQCLLETAGISFDQLSLYIDFAGVINDDETLLAGAYLAVRSAIEKRPLRDDALLACQLSPTGEILSLPKLNQRLMTSMAHGPVYIFERDRAVKINHDFYAALSAAAGDTPLKLKGIFDADELYQEVLFYELAQPGQRQSESAHAIEAS